MKQNQVLVLLLAVVFFTACGSKKEPAKQLPDTQAADTTNPGPTISADEAKKKAEADKKAQDEANSKKRAPKEKQGEGKKSSQSSAKNQNGLALTGGVTKSGMLFSGSSNDGVITQLLAEEKSKSEEQQRKNAALAASIWDMAYLIDNQGQLHLDIELKKGKGLTKVQAKTQYLSGQKISIVSNQGTSSGIELRAECLDRDVHSGKCWNLLVSVLRDGAEATAVLRQSLANIWFEYEKVTQANEYATLVQFFQNAKQDVESPNKVSTAFLHTYEVVNGKAGFKAVITGTRNQLMAFSADLLVKKNSLEPNIAVEKETQFKALDLWMGRTATKDLAFMKSISDVVLVQNNTKGEITLDMLVSSASTGSTNSFTLKFSRIHVPGEL